MSDYRAMSVKVLVETVFPQALAAAQAARDAGVALHGDDDDDDAVTASHATYDAYVGVARATVAVDRQQITPVQAQSSAVAAWSQLGLVRQFLIDSGLDLFGAVSQIFRAIVDNIAYAIKALTTTVAEAMRILFGGTPGDWMTRVFILGGVFVVGWIYIAGFTAGGQAALMSAGRGNLAFLQGLGAANLAVGKGVATHVLPALWDATVKLVPSLTGII